MFVYIREPAAVFIGALFLVYNIIWLIEFQHMLAVCLFYIAFGILSAFVCVVEAYHFICESAWLIPSSFSACINVLNFVALQLLLKNDFGHCVWLNSFHLFVFVSAGESVCVLFSIFSFYFRIAYGVDTLLIILYVIWV